MVRAHQTKTDWVAAELRSAINLGRLRPGERIRIRDWSDRLDVSFTPLREAIKMLAVEGFVVMNPHRGAVVASVSSSEFLDAYRIRLSLDVLASELAVERLEGEARESLCEKLLSINAQLEAVLRRADALAAEELNRQFHSLIYDAIDSPLLHRTRHLLTNVVPVAGAGGAFWEMVSRSRAIRDELVTQHANIADAIRLGDSGRAAEATKQHSQSGTARLIELIQRADQQHDTSGDTLTEHLAQIGQQQRAPS